MNFDLEDLEAFLAVKATGSFQAAAARLARSQSAVTRRVQKLEAALDVALFERTTRSVKPTLAAKRLEPRAEALLADAAETLRAMRDDSVAFAHQRNLVITLAAIPTLIPALIPDALGLFRSEGHRARLRFLDGDANGVAEAVASGAADFGLTSMPALDPALAFDPLFEDRLVLVHPMGKTVSDQGEFAWSDLADHEVILPARDTGNRVLIDEAMARQAVDLRWIYEVARSTTALALVASGIGVAILPLSLVQSTRDPRLSWARLTAPEIARPVGLLRRRGMVDTGHGAALLDAIRRAAHRSSADD
ncbi:MAG: LysR family transcriptional regulator [Silicimonas sp.]|nr:LysR family transcriptional regulator [Silicimonas sp.]